MTFNIGSQNANVINNVAGDQWSQVTITDDEAREQVRQLRAAVERVGLPPEAASQARTHLAEVEAEMKQPEPRKAAVAAKLKQVLQVIITAGSLAKAGALLAGPVGAVAGWLGGLGKPLLDMLVRRS